MTDDGRQTTDKPILLPPAAHAHTRGKKLTSLCPSARKIGTAIIYLYISIVILHSDFVPWGFTFQLLIECGFYLKLILYTVIFEVHV
jgi:hypothetical protein